MKQKILNIIGTILICLGIVIILGTISDKIETKKKQQVLIDVFENDENDDDGIDDQSSDISDKYNPIAILDIPSINFTQAIVDGVSNESIKYYVGHFEGTAMPGEKGNFALAAHNVSSYSDAFKNLHKLSQGDIVKVKTKDYEFIYEVTDNFIVKPENVEVLDQTADSTITMITCTADGKERVVVKGKLIESNSL